MADINNKQSDTFLHTINAASDELKESINIGGFYWCLKLDRNQANGIPTFEWKDSINIGGFNWYLKLERNQVNGIPKFDLFITCNEECKDKLWMAEVNIFIKSIDVVGHSHRIRRNGCMFHNGNVFELSKVFSNWNSVEDEDAILEVELNVLRSNSKHRMMALDTDLRFIYASQEGNEQRNVEKVIAVNKHALASISTYFQNLFFGNCSERRTMDAIDSFTIHEDAGFDIHAFSTMIYASMAMGWMVHASGMFTNSMVQDPPNSKDLNDRMVMKILKLSVKYDIPMMADYSEKYLISLLEQRNFPKIGLPELLDEAEQLGLQELKEATLKSMNDD